MKFFKIGVSLALLFSLFFAAVSSTHAKESDGQLATLMMVPLDDRPANLYFPQQVGESAGIDVITPPQDIIGYFDKPGQGKKSVNGCWVFLPKAPKRYNSEYLNKY